MWYRSLGTGSVRRSFGEAVKEGIAPDRSLYVPDSVPRLGPSDWSAPVRSPAELGVRMLAPLCAPDLDEATLRAVLEEVFAFPLPLREAEPGVYLLEQFHGPTHAFKDIGARFLSRILQRITRQRQTVLVATSGDTGSAVAQGFRDVAGIDVVILYPSGRISAVQEQQLTTVGGNVQALEVAGSFDDCQRMVKAAFRDRALRKRRLLTSANSINVGRWLPQAIPFAWAVHQLGARVRFCVPTGNLGNLSAGVLAGNMGMPHQGFLVASNANDGLARFLSGEDFSARPSVQTLSNAMDVGDPSNRSRLEALFGGDRAALRKTVQGVSITDEETLETMRVYADRFGLLLCPHTAVGVAALSHRPAPRGTPTVVLATAHPAKFGEVVKQATGRTPPLPPLLAACLRKEKRSVRIPASEQALKTWLWDER